METNIGISVKGSIKITDVTDNNHPVVLVEKNNQINYEAISEAIASSFSNQGSGTIFQMVFGNGAASVDATGLITYLPPNVTGLNAALYNQTFQKIVDGSLISNTDPTRNKMTISHVAGKLYTDILVQCLLDYGEPDGQSAFDNATATDTAFTFDELGLTAQYGTDGTGTPVTKLISHVVFHPIQKSLNRQIQIDYTIRIAAITSLITI